MIGKESTVDESIKNEKMNINILKRHVCYMANLFYYCVFSKYCIKDLCLPKGMKGREELRWSIINENDQVYRRALLWNIRRK